MKYDTEIVINANALEEEVKSKYQIEDFNLADLMWPCDFMNDCYKSLYIADDEELYFNPEEDPEEAEKIELRNLIYRHLRAIFPNTDRVLVDVSW